MSRFIFIDHSLKRVGGHHFDYAFHVLTAVESAGFDVVLATHRRFRKSREDIPQSWNLSPVYRCDTYQPYTVFRGNTPIDRRSFGNWRHNRRREKVISSFRRSCNRLFQDISLREGDHVFLATLSELDLLGLAQYLSANERTRDVDWHLQFHYNIFEGRDPEYAQQRTRLEAVRSQFQLALGKLSNHRLHFYNTSEPLNDQYNCLHVARFESLAYPINPDFTKPRRQRKPDRPLRITCAGAIRTEKGHSRLSRLVLSLWQGCLANGKAQLVVQSKKSHRRDVPRLQLAQPGRPQAKAGFTRPDETNSSEPIVYVRQPLSTEDYVKFVRGADIGLMLYDSHRYYARRAGVLGEFLAAGIPVIVPAGCWLAEQIKEPMFQHLDRVADSLPITRQDFLPKMTFGDASDPAVASLMIPHSSEEMLVSFRLGEPRCKGRYVRLEAFQFDKEANLLHRTVQTIGHRAERGLSRTLFHLHPNAAQVRLHWRNAYHHELLTVDGVEVSFHSTQSDSGTYPASAVGLIAAEQSAVPSLIREMIAHFDHYKKTAEEFSRDWFRRHDPAETVAQLVKHRANRPGLLTDYEAA